MILRLLLAYLLVLVPLHAWESYPELTSADGSQTMFAKPVAVVDGGILFERQGGEEFTASVDNFSESDRKNLGEWRVALEKDSHLALQRRVKQAETLRVLFVGNSYSFQIPKVFEKLAKTEGKRIEVSQMTKGGWTLEKHAASQETLGKISKGKWDVVVLQEQSMIPAFPEEQRNPQMNPPAKKLADAVRTAGAVPVFFLTWGRRDGDKQNAAVFPNDTYAAMQKRLFAGYRSAARQAGDAYVVPVGVVWAMLRLVKNDEGLYANDGSHPAPRGNYLAACVFFSAFYNETVEEPAREIEDAAGIADAATAAKRVELPYPLVPRT